MGEVLHYSRTKQKRRIRPLWIVIPLLLVLAVPILFFIDSGVEREVSFCRQCGAERLREGRRCPGTTGDAHMLERSHHAYTGQRGCVGTRCALAR